MDLEATLPATQMYITRLYTSLALLFRLLRRDGIREISVNADFYNRSNNLSSCFLKTQVTRKHVVVLIKISICWLYRKSDQCRESPISKFFLCLVKKNLLLWISCFHTLTGFNYVRSRLVCEWELANTIRA